MIDAYIRFEKPLLYDTMLSRDELRAYLERLTEMQTEYIMADEGIPIEDAEWYTTVADFGGLEAAVENMLDDNALDVMGGLLGSGALAEHVN